MSSSYEEPKSWPVESETEADADSMVEKLRREIAAARQRLDEHREQMTAIGMRRPDKSDDSDASA